MKRSGAVIDNDVLGWADEQKERLLEDYGRLFQVSKHPELPEGSGDDEIATFCKTHDCDLFTADTRGHKGFFKAGIRSIKITEYQRWSAGKKTVFLIQISK